MPLLLVLLIGGLAGVLAARFMKLEVDVIVAIAIGVLGALFGGIALRFLFMTFAAAANSVLAIFIGGLFGAVVLIWVFRFFSGKK